MINALRYAYDYLYSFKISGSEHNTKFGVYRSRRSRDITIFKYVIPRDHKIKRSMEMTNKNFW